MPFPSTSHRDPHGEEQVDQGELRLVIGAVLPLADIARAHTLVEGGSAGGRPRGKIAVAELSR
ncbi:hypothetical protein BS329_13895 [Amycolatopsis coloradensis]|uniref:Uncharacterized protein n=1 Tax=Amycolatopsis coloradensis TaxID=76021 RepID=A0A1R0KUW3_9PSEU|nr:hypothetical protein [Amycolatopsis coloradensis]OLZ52411.1 hypothetical protein BS329_13895 [Amycolatopsis coloradensis]